MASDESEFQKHKTDLETRLEQLEQEMATLIIEVDTLREKRVILGLQKKADSLQETVDLLKKEKMDLENEVSSLQRGR
jgi:predicted HTH domain antitoxin